MVTLSYRNRLPKQIIANRQSTIDLQSYKQDERVSKKLNTNTNWNPHGTHNKHTQRERKSESVGTATSADVTRTTRRGDNCLPFEISSSYVVGGVSGDCTVCVCLSVGGGAWEWQRERERGQTSTNFITWATYACAWAACVCVVRDTARHVRNYWRATGCCIICPHRKWAAFRIRFRLSFDSIQFDSIVDRA